MGRNNEETLIQKRDRLKKARFLAGNPKDSNVDGDVNPQSSVSVEPEPQTVDKLDGEVNGNGQEPATATQQESTSLDILGLSRSFDCSGKRITFVSTSLDSEKILDETYVDERSNGRKQDLLTDVNLKALILGIQKRGQLSPAYGFRHPNGLIEIIDGSRRRVAAHKANEPFWVMVCNLALYNAEISLEDKIEIRNDLQTAREQSLYDLGHECLAHEIELGTAEKVAKYLKISATTVSRVKKYSRIPVEIIGLFDDYNVLKRADFEKLGTLVSQSVDLGISMEDLAIEILESIDSADNLNSDHDFDPVIQADNIIKLISARIKDCKIKKKPVADTIPLHIYNKGAGLAYRATRKTERKGGHVTEVFTLKDAPRELCKQVDILIANYKSGSTK